MANNIQPSRLMHVTTPQILWHGGGNENGKPDPVYSVDFHPTLPILATAGIDGGIPANGCVRVSYYTNYYAVILEIAYLFPFLVVEN
jgi:hypothetical protein